MGTMIELSASDGFRLAAYRADPQGTPRGGLVVVQEIFGVNSHIRSVCDGYDREEKGVELGYTAADIARGREHKAKASADAALLDVDAARAAVASAGRVGIVGYCWGGFITWLAACRLRGFGGAISYYGGGILEAGGEKPKCPVIAHFGERDSVIPVAGVRAFAAAHPDVDVHVYAADHGFNCDQRGSYDAAAATLARQRSLDFLREHIG